MKLLELTPRCLLHNDERLINLLRLKSLALCYRSFVAQQVYALRTMPLRAPHPGRGIFINAANVAFFTYGTVTADAAFSPRPHL